MGILSFLAPLAISAVDGALGMLGNSQQNDYNMKIAKYQNDYNSEYSMLYSETPD